MVNITPVGKLIPFRDELDEGGVICKLKYFEELVTGGEKRGDRTQSWGNMMVLESESCCPSLTCCLLSVRKSVIHLQMESGTLS